MHSVVNHIPLAPGADWGELVRLFDGFCAEILPAHPEALAIEVIRTSDAEMILVITFTDAETMASFSSKVAAPWFAEHIRRFMGGPADRKTGEIVASYKRG